MTDHTAPRPSWPPTLTPADIHPRKDIGARVTTYHAQLTGTHPSGRAVRFTLPFISDYIEHLDFTAEVFNPETLAWNPLWTIPGAAYEYGGLDDRDAQKDPRTNILARRHDNHVPHLQATSWQKIINALAAKVDEILPD
ncbi:hypothetical protein ABH933_001215 [Nocardia sp. GP40]|uniref:hypothetical protein n=1 Tax=Nocardia sp. GP40 TaxID=3156268 RepID=UPI003D1B2037